MDNLLRYYLPLFLMFYLLITFVVPSVRVYKQTGINPVKFGKEDNAHNYIGGVMKVLTALLVFSILSYSLGNKLYSYLTPIPFLESKLLKYIGLFIVHATLAWIVIAQVQMKNSWRIGIDNDNKTVLITNSVFKASRNPIFLGMILSTIGIFLIVPNALTFFITATSYIIIQIQIRLEEEHLLTQHGSRYLEYKKTVRRLI